MRWIWARLQRMRRILCATPFSHLCEPPSHSEYEMLGAQVGEGTFGGVWRARRRVDNSLVVMKMAHPREGEAAGIQRAANEYFFLKQCERPHIIKALGVYASSHPFQAALVLEFAECSLEAMLSNTNTFENDLENIHLTPNRATFHLFSGIAAIHERAFVHRDVKPGNILIVRSAQDGHGVLKVSDFGSMIEAASKINDHAQTRPYRSPEVHMGGRCEISSDMWSVGCVLCELMGWTQNGVK